MSKREKRLQMEFLVKTDLRLLQLIGLPAQKLPFTILVLTRHEVADSYINFTGRYTNTPLWSDLQHCRKVCRDVLIIARIALLTLDDEKLLWQSAGLEDVHVALSGAGDKMRC